MNVGDIVAYTGSPKSRGTLLEGRSDKRWRVHFFVGGSGNKMDNNMSFHESELVLIQPTTGLAREIGEYINRELGR